MHIAGAKPHRFRVKIECESKAEAVTIQALFPKGDAFTVGTLRVKPDLYVSIPAGTIQEAAEWVRTTIAQLAIS